MSQLVHLVRHGEVENPRRLVYADLPGFHLSERGRAEAEAAAEHLKTLGVQAIYSSPLDRARQTSAIIAARLGVEVRIDEDLTEWLLARRWRGVPWEELPSRFPGELEAFTADPTNLPFSPESVAQLGLRVAAAIERSAGAHPGDIVVVSHQDPLQAGRLTLCRIPLNAVVHNRPGHCDVITLRPGEVWEEVGHWRPAPAGFGDPPEWPPIETA